MADTKKGDATATKEEDALRQRKGIKTSQDKEEKNTGRTEGGSFDAAEWQKRVAELAKEVERVKEADKRRLHSKVELARMDMCDEPEVEAYLDALAHETDQKKQNEIKSASPLHQQITSLIADFDRLRKSLEFRRDRSVGIFTYYRMVACFLWLLVFLPLFAFGSILRPLHPLWLLLGIPRQWFPLDTIIRTYCNGTLIMAGIDLYVQGLENLDCNNSGVVMFNHISNLDPIVVAAAPGPAQKWIAKNDLFKIPIIGWVMWGIGHISIDRRDRAKAIKSIQVAQNIIANRKRSIAISPEGTRSKTGQLMEFKKGPFHLAKDVGAPIIPILTQGAYELYPPGQIFTKTGVVVLKFLPAIPIKKNEDHNKILNRVRRIFLAELSKDFFEEGHVRRTVTLRTKILSVITSTLMLLAVFGPIVRWMFF